MSRPPKKTKIKLTTIAMQNANMLASFVWSSDYPIQNHFRTRDIPLSQPVIKILSTLLSIEGN